MLKEAVESVLEQTYKNIEIIIVNDGSTDNTITIANNLASKYSDKIQVIHQPTGGPGLAREAGRQRASGEYIQYLDSDDLLLPQKFEVQINGLSNHPDCDVSYGKTRYRHRDGTVENSPWKKSGIKVDTMFPTFLLDRWWDTPTPLYRSIVCDKAGPWTNLKHEEDWEYDCRIAALGVKLHYCDMYLAEVRDHDEHRLCRGDAHNPERLKERSKAHKLIYSHAINAKIDSTCVEMQHFSRALFLLSRQCGASGLVNESKDLFTLAINASEEKRAKGFDFKIYKTLSLILGWKLMGKMSCFLDKFRS